MNDGFQYGDLLFLGLIAAFVLLRLRSMLGKDQGIDPREAWKQASREVEQEKVTQLAGPRPIPAHQKKEEEQLMQKIQETPQLADGLKAIRAADAQFSPSEFVQGAKLAFEWLVSAFSKGEKDKLKMLLSEERYKVFTDEIDANVKEAKFPETTLVAISAADITEATLKGGKAQVTVQFTSEQIHVVRDKDKNIISGDMSAIENVVDVWTFERDTSSKDPNWKIVAT